MNQPQQPLDYEQVKQALEAELRRVEALQELHTLIKDMQAWLNGDETDGKERDAK
jgi:hypothetical protein